MIAAIHRASAVVSFKWSLMLVGRKIKELQGSPFEKKFVSWSLKPSGKVDIEEKKCGKLPAERSH